MSDLAADLKAAELSRHKTWLNIESMQPDIDQHHEIVRRYENDKSISESSRQLYREANRLLYSLLSESLKLHNKLDEQDYDILFLQDLRERGSFPFQRLPIEIQRTILELLFIRGTWIRLRVNPRYSTSREKYELRTLAFLRTSRQMFELASSVFYNKNRFRHVSEPGSTGDLFRTLGGSLRNLALEVTSDMKLPELGLLENCQNLQRLHLRIREVPSGRIPKSIAIPNTLTELILSVSESDEEKERARKERFKRRLDVLLRIGGKPRQILRHSERLRDRN